MKLKTKHTLIASLSIFLAEYYVKKQLNIKTKANYQMRFNNIVMYLKSIGKENTLAIDVNYELLKDYEVQHSETHSYDHIARNIELIKASLNRDVIKKKIPYNPVVDYETKRRRPKDVVHVTYDELCLIIDYTPPKRLQLSRDCYIIQSLTGLSFADLRTFKMTKDSKGEWITGYRRKPPHKQYWIPLDSRVKEILNKYNEGLPRVHNWYYNKQLKEIAKEVGIEKHLTTHTGRKTFATIMYDRGVSVEVIADMMANTVLVLQERYIGKSRRRIEYELPLIKLS